MRAAKLSLVGECRLKDPVIRGMSVLMIRIWIIGSALVLALTTPAVAQPRRVPIPQILERLHALCEQDYKPACIKFGAVIGSLPPNVSRTLRKDHPEWWWWERW